MHQQVITIAQNPDVIEVASGIKPTKRLTAIIIVLFFLVESYGLSVSEAQQNYNEKKDALTKLAFCMAPMSFNFNLGNR
ncbi:hypothetical protein [Klebsiella pneumoniae]|uniref:hypothetical protein n=1 Tax=Klebsiella pneumoniae TaxID=573 RepID=UPI001F4BAB7E|nr:hypothetical protein [Klebsiella pneumoniae]